MNETQTKQMSILIILDSLFTQKRIPSDVANNIMIMIYHMEHRDQVKQTRLHQQVLKSVFDKNLLGHSDLETTINHYFDCNCCQHHQNSKACIKDGELVIMTKPCVFKPWVYDTDENMMCECDCRHQTRMHARDWLQQSPAHYGDGPIYNWSKSLFSLGLKFS